MAKVIYNKKNIEIANNTEMKFLESEGILFGCSSGVCGVCKVKISKGMENLTPITEDEEMHSLEQNERLLCQCKIKQGVVEIDEG